MIAGKMIGPMYTLQHHRWDVTATGGWLTGLRGGHVSVNGTYKLLDGVGTETMGVYAGLGLFGQGFTAASGSKQERFAKRMNYDTPFGVQIATKMHIEFSEKWSYEMHIGMPLIFTENDFSGEKRSAWELMLYTFQLSLQYKLKNTGKEK